MSKRTTKFVMLPWMRGLDLATDEGIAQLLKHGDYLTEASDILFHPNGSKDKREGFGYHDGSAITNTPNIKGGFDYWATLNSVKTQRILVVDEGGTVDTTSKIWIQQPAGGVAWDELAKATSAVAPKAVTRVSFEVMNDDLIMAFTSSNNAKPVKWDNMSETMQYESLGGNPPAFKFMRVHQGRVWAAGDPDRPDRLHFSSPGNHEEWQGEGDSGAIDIDPGDGDSSGITAIFPSFRGVLIVAKANRLYKIDGTSPIDYRVTMLSGGLGCISHNSAVAIDMDDIYFMSERGFHSLVVTEKYGDFEGTFLSSDIQPDFNDLDKSFLQYAQGVWIPTLNSVMWNVSEDGTTMDKIWLFDIRFKAWYKWTGIKPEALFRVEDSSTKYKRAYVGDDVGRLSKTQTASTYHDYTSTAITQAVKTPYLYPDNDPATIKSFKKLGIWMKADSGTTLTATVTIGGISSSQTLTFTSNESSKMKPYTLPIDGYGPHIQIRFTNAVADKRVNLFGFWVEWEPSGDSQETK